MDNEDFESLRKPKRDYRNMIKATDPEFQTFLSKTARIVKLFLKDKNAPHELIRSVLQYLGVVVSLLDISALKGDDGIAKQSLEAVFSAKRHNMKKHMMLIRKIVSKLIKKMGSTWVRKAMPEEHKALVTYIERMWRKKQNKKIKDKLGALMG